VGYTYAVDGNLVLCSPGSGTGAHGGKDPPQTTYLLGFKLDGTSATPSYLGSVDGDTLDTNTPCPSTEGHLRVATTVDKLFGQSWQPSSWMRMV
jgi:hypothetical protein